MYIHIYRYRYIHTTKSIVKILDLIVFEKQTSNNCIAYVSCKIEIQNLVII